MNYVMKAQYSKVIVQKHIHHERNRKGSFFPPKTTDYVVHICMQPLTAEKWPRAASYVAKGNMRLYLIKQTHICCICILG